MTGLINILGTRRTPRLNPLRIALINKSSKTNSCPSARPSLITSYIARAHVAVTSYFGINRYKLNRYDFIAEHVTLITTNLCVILYVAQSFKKF